MARNFTVQDARAIMQLLVQQATGQTNIAVVDTSTFVSAGELVLSQSIENVYNALNIVLGRLISASRPYKAKLKLMDALDTGVYTSRLRKISYYSKFPKNAGAFNTNLYTNLHEGFTAGQNFDNQTPPVAQSVKSQWEQNLAMPLEMNFGGSASWDNCITQPEYQAQVAFRDEAEFIKFLTGYMQEHANDIEQQREAWNRMALVNKIASVYDMRTYMPGSVIDLVAGYNAKFNTSYTGAQLRTTYLKDFLAYFVTEFKLVSEYMTERSANYHWSVPKTVDGVTYHVLRHTPYRDQRVYLYSKLFKDAEAQVLPEIFNPEYLDIKTQYEDVTYWQSVDDRGAIKCTPAITDADPASPTYGTQVQGTSVDLPYVVGMITDRDGLMTDMMLDSVATTPLEARKKYRNTWQTFLKGVISDNTEKVCIFIMSS